MRDRSVAAHARPLLYFPLYRQIVGSVKAAILFSQLEYWFSFSPEGFYKFLSPVPGHRLYRVGDSWTEELAWSESEFRRTYEEIGVKHSSYTQFSKQTNKFLRCDGSTAFYCSFHDKIKGTTWYHRNDRLVDRAIKEMYTAAGTQSIKRVQAPRASVYIIKCLNRIKISVAARPEIRVEQMRLTITDPIELIGAWPLVNALDVVMGLRNRYAKHRVNREWFDLSSELLTKIQAYLAKLCQSSDVENLTYVDDLPLVTEMTSRKLHHVHETTRHETTTNREVDTVLIFDYWKEKCGHSRAKLDSVRKEIIVARLTDGYTVNDLLKAIDGASVDPFTQGKTKNNSTKYDALGIIFRDAEHVDKFIDVAEHRRELTALERSIAKVCLMNLDKASEVERRDLFEAADFLRSKLAHRATDEQIIDKFVKPWGAWAPTAIWKGRPPEPLWIIKYWERLQVHLKKQQGRR